MVVINVAGKQNKQQGHPSGWSFFINVSLVLIATKQKTPIIRSAFCLLGARRGLEQQLRQVAHHDRHAEDHSKEGRNHRGSEHRFE